MILAQQWNESYTPRKGCLVYTQINVFRVLIFTFCERELNT